MKKLALAVLLVLVMTAPAMAKIDITIPNTYTQPYFKDLSTDLGLAIAYVPMSPAEPLGGLLPGFDAGVEMSVVQLDTNKAYWKLVTPPGSTKVPGTLPFPKVHVQVGLPIVPIDLGVVYATVPGTDIKYTGGEIKFAILKGGIVMPALAVRGAMTKLSGIDVIDLSTKSLDLSVSKGFLMLTPYAGIGKVWIDSTPKGTIATSLNLKSESISENKYFAGLKFSLLPILNIVAEADFSKIKEYSLRLNVHF